MHQISKLRCFLSRLSVVFVQSIETRCQVENEDVVGAAPTGDAPTTSEWSTILLTFKVRLILEIWRYAKFGNVQFMLASEVGSITKLLIFYFIDDFHFQSNFHRTGVMLRQELWWCDHFELCTCHNSFAAVACTKFCSDLMAKYWFTAKMLRLFDWN